MSFKAKHEHVPKRYNEIWNSVIYLIRKEYNVERVQNDKYITFKILPYNDKNKIIAYYKKKLFFEIDNNIYQFSLQN